MFQSHTHAYTQAHIYLCIIYLLDNILRIYNLSTTALCSNCLLTSNMDQSAPKTLTSFMKDSCFPDRLPLCHQLSSETWDASLWKAVLQLEFWKDSVCLLSSRSSQSNGICSWNIKKFRKGKSTSLFPQKWIAKIAYKNKKCTIFNFSSLQSSWLE